VTRADFPGNFSLEAAGARAAALAFNPAMTMAKLQPPIHINNINPANVFMDISFSR